MHKDTHVDLNTIQVAVGQIANSQLQNTTIHCEKFETRHNIYASFNIIL